MTSRSRFYVDTPRDPTQRHSMFVSHSELAREGGPDSSSATLPSAAGSVDRLTGLEEKKSSRFFTLKPKTSFSLRPFFKSSSSLISLSSPGKRRKTTLERRDSNTQTEQESRPEVGVQTLNASTVDVPVQTCSETWEEGDSYGQKRLAYPPARASPFWNRPYGTSSGFSNSLTAKNLPIDPLASPKLIKYAAPGNSAKIASVSSQSAVSPLGVNSCQPVSPPPRISTPDSTNVPVKYFSAKELTSNAISLAASPQNQSAKEFSVSVSTETYDNLCLPSTKSEDDIKDNANSLFLPSSPPVPIVKNSDVPMVKDSNNDLCFASLNISTGEKDKDKDLCKTEAPLPLGGKTSSDTPQEVSEDSKYSLSQSTDSPLSALKFERTDSPSRRSKTVHFDLPKSEQSSNSPETSCKPRNVDKDFEALLRDLNIWTGSSSDESELQISFDSVPPPNQCPTPTLLSPNLKSAIEILKQDFLAPIPETANENNESEENNEYENHDTINLIESGTNYDNEIGKSDITCDTNPNNGLVCANESKSETIFLSKTVDENFKILGSKIPLTRSISEYENLVSAKVNKNDFVTPTSEPIITSANLGSNAETDSLEGNVYDNVIKEENPVKTVPLPTLPFFFEPPPQTHFLETTEIVEYVNENSFECPSNTEKLSEMPFETDFERNRLSRSSSRSSVRSSTKNGFDSLREPVNRFDSCENLDQLEEEIIRSLYSPDEGKLQENIMKNIDLPPSETFQNSGTTATHMRRVILDQLLSGKSVSDIVPNYKGYQRAQSVPETTSKYKPAKKYTAVLTKIENDDYDNSLSSKLTSGDVQSIGNHYDSAPNENSVNQFKNAEIADTKDADLSKMLSPKKTSVFLFPEDKLLNSSMAENSAVEISTSPQQNRGPSVLEVRRSSWTPQSTVDDASNNSSFVTVIENSPVPDENLPRDKSGHFDFTNCLRPSKMQNSIFLSKINARSMSPCNFPHLPPVHTPSPAFNNSTIKRNESPAKVPEAIGECDFASCLKPSQVQNSLFTAELSEITAGKSNNSLRAASPLPVRVNSPLPIRSSSLDNPSAPTIKSENKTIQVIDSEPVNHKSELLITLQTAAKHSSDSNDKQKYGEPNENGICSSQEVYGQNEKKIIDVVLQTKATKESTASPSSPPPLPPPPPPPFSQAFKSLTAQGNGSSDTSLESMIKDQKSNLTTVELPVGSRCTTPTPKTPVMAELEKRLQNRCNTQTYDSDDKPEDKHHISSDEREEISNGGSYGSNVNGAPNYLNGNQLQNGSIGILSEPREYSSPVSNGKSNGSGLHTAKLTFTPNTIVTDEPPPSGAVLLDKKVTVDGDKVHTDKFYAIPVKEVLKEKTSTTKFIPAPPKYEGIGPTEDGIPIGLRNSVKKENMHNWYKTMFKSLHKADSSNDSQEYIIGYTSEPETSKKDVIVKKKSSTLDSRLKQDANSNFSKQNYPPSAKSSIEVYNVRPRLIEDYEPGHSSVTDDEIITSRRYLPALNTPKPSYEFKNGYESDTTVTRKRDQPDSLTPEQQKMWYREVQKGADIPQFGLGKQTPEKPKEPSIGPIPPPPMNYSGPSYQQAVRPLTLPADYSNQNGNGYCQQMNGSYEMQMRHAIHSEMHQRRSPNCNQLSPPVRTMGRSPSRSPDMRIPAQALFDFKAESPKEIPLKKGDTVLILRQLDKNWYEGEHKGVVGIFPISYVEIVPPEHASTPIKPKPGGLGRALYDFVAQTSVELTVRKGDTITLIRRVDANWFEAIFKSKKGIVPVSYIQVLQEPVERNVKSPSPRSYNASPSSENKEKLNANSISPSAYSSSSNSPLPVTQERRRLPSKKGSHLIEPVMYRALYSYSPQNTDELELQEGDSVYVVEMCDDGWFVGTSVRTGVFGIFPGNYVEKAC